MYENEISQIVLNAAIEVHRTLRGPGPLEGAYEEALRLVINFGERFVKDGFHRVANGL